MEPPHVASETSNHLSSLMADPAQALAGDLPHTSAPTVTDDAGADDSMSARIDDAEAAGASAELPDLDSTPAVTVEAEETEAVEAVHLTDAASEHGAASADVVAADVPVADVPVADVPAADVPAADGAAADGAAAEVQPPNAPEPTVDPSEVDLPESDQPEGVATALEADPFADIEGGARVDEPAAVGADELDALTGTVEPEPLAAGQPDDPLDLDAAPTAVSTESSDEASLETESSAVSTEPVGEQIAAVAASAEPTPDDEVHTDAATPESVPAHEPVAWTSPAILDTLVHEPAAVSSSMTQRDGAVTFDTVVLAVAGATLLLWSIGNLIAGSPLRMTVLGFVAANLAFAGALLRRSASY
ncbi:MAG: hypothetical protein R3F56_22130 [Planctomycetota bacterium]